MGIRVVCLSSFVSILCMLYWWSRAVSRLAECQHRLRVTPASCDRQRAPGSSRGHLDRVFDPQRRIWNRGCGALHSGCAKVQTSRKLRSTPGPTQWGQGYRGEDEARRPDRAQPAAGYQSQQLRRLASEGWRSLRACPDKRPCLSKKLEEVIPAPLLISCRKFF